MNEIIKDLENIMDKIKVKQKEKLTTNATPIDIALEIQQLQQVANVISDTIEQVKDFI